MGKNNKGTGIGLGIVALVVSQFIIRTIGVENMSAQVIDATLLVICIASVVGIYKNRERGFGVKYNTILAMLIVVNCITLGTFLTMLKNYPIQAKEHKMLILVVGLGAYFSLMVYVIVVKIYIDKKR